VIEKGASVVGVLTGNMMKDPSYTIDYHTDSLKFGEQLIKGNFANRPVRVPADKDAIRRILNL
jgi:threonine synthase